MKQLFLTLLFLSALTLAAPMGAAAQTLDAPPVPAETPTETQDDSSGALDRPNPPVEPPAEEPVAKEEEEK